MNQFPEEDDMLRRFWQDGKKEAPEGFSDFIMEHLPQPAPLPDALKRPLLSPGIMAALTGLLVALGILLNQLSGGTESLTPWQQKAIQWMANGAGVLGTSSSLLPTLAVVSVAVVLLIGLDRLLQRYLHKA